MIGNEAAQWRELRVSVVGLQGSSSLHLPVRICQHDAGTPFLLLPAQGRKFADNARLA